MLRHRHQASRALSPKPYRGGDLRQREPLPPIPPGGSLVLSVVREFVAEFGRARLLAEFAGAGIVGAAFALVWWLA